VACGTNGDNEGCGRFEQSEHVSVAYTQNELSRHERKMEQKSGID